MSDPLSPTFNLPAAEISRRQERCAEIDREIDNLRKERAEQEEWLRAAQIIAPSLFLLAQPKPAKGRGQATMRKGLLTWPRIIEEAVRNSGSGMRQRDLLESIRSGRHGKRLDGSESGYYNAIQKVLRKKAVVKRGEWLFTPAQFEEYMRRVVAGEISDYAEEAEYGSPTAAEAVRFVTSNPGAKSIDVIRHIWTVQKAGEGELQSKTSLYNVLARLVEQEKLTKDSEGGFHPYKEVEAPNGDAAGASIEREVAASLFENVVGFPRPR